MRHPLPKKYSPLIGQAQPEHENFLTPLRIQNFQIPNSPLP